MKNKRSLVLLLACLTALSIPLVALAAGEGTPKQSTYHNASFHHVTPCADGVYVSGRGPGGKTLIAKYGMDGELVWATSETFEDGDVLGSLVDTGDGVIAVGNRLNGGEIDLTDAVICKLDANGKIEWRATYAEYPSQSFWSVSADSQGYTALLIYNDMIDHGVDNALVRYDKQGKLVNAVDMSSDTEGYGDMTNGLLLIGGRNAGGGLTKPVLNQVDTGGNSKFKLELSTDYSIRDVYEDTDGYVLVGHGPSSSAWIRKIDKNGNTLWERFANGDNFAGYMQVAQVGGHYVVFGQTGAVAAGPATQYTDIIAVYDKAGNQTDWRKTDWQFMFRDARTDDICGVGDTAFLVGNLLGVNTASIITFNPISNSAGQPTPTPSQPTVTPTPSQPTPTQSQPSATPTPSPTNSDGWAQEGNNWYYYEGGQKATGWKKVGNNWYYLEPVMATGWKNLGDTWYYLKPSGAMATGWQKIGNVWYNFAGSGAMKTGWSSSGGKWYYLKPSGAMAANAWQQIDGKWYWFDSSGVMATGSRIINGKRYRFSSSGVWIG